MKSRILFGALISIVLLFYITKDSRACFPSPIEGTEVRYGLFVPYSTQLRTVDGMYFSFGNMHDHENTKGIEADRQINVSEWYNYIHGEAEKKAIYELLYNMDPVAFLSGKTMDSSDAAIWQNSFFRYLMQPSHKAVMDYMTIAKNGEYYTHTDPVDPWDNDYNKPEPIDRLQQPIAQALAAGVHDDFLRARYLYLDIRYQYYMPMTSTDTVRYPYSGIEDEYAALLKIPGHSVVKGWAAYFNALSVYSFDPARGNYLLAQAFNLSNDKKAPIYRHFSSELLLQSLHHTKSKAEQANLYALTAMNNHGEAVSTIEKVYKLDPSNPNLPLLLVREISKLEDRFFTPKYTNFDAQVRPGHYLYDGNPGPNRFLRMDKLYLNRWKSFLTAAASDSRAKDKFFYDLCLAHTYLIDSDPGAARTWLDSARLYRPSDPELLCQYQLTDFAATVAEAKELDGKFESDILIKLKWLDANRDHFENAELVFKQIHLLLSHKYEETGSISRAILTRSRYDWYAYYKTVASGYYFNISTTLYQYMQGRASGPEAEAFINMVTKRSKSAFEKYYADPILKDTQTLNQACDAAGSNYLREGIIKVHCACLTGSKETTRMPKKTMRPENIASGP